MQLSMSSREGPHGRPRRQAAAGTTSGTYKTVKASLAHIRQSRPVSGTYKTVNMAHVRQSRPDYGLGITVKAVEISEVVPLGSSAAGSSAWMTAPSSISWCALLWILVRVFFEPQILVDPLDIRWKVTMHVLLFDSDVQPSS